ncbi:MAG TPA: isochorismatase family protein [Limnochordales bacterium]
MKPWAHLISREEEETYRAAGFGKRVGVGARPALLIIDVQYRTAGTQPKPLREAVKEFPTSCGEAAWEAIRNIQRLLEEFRRHDLPVLYPHVAPKQSYDAGRLAAKVPTMMSIPEKGYEFVAEIAPRANDILLPKRHPSAFFGTPLVSYLVDLGVDTLFVTGCTTSGCVRSTVVDAFSYNFRVIVPQDCVYDRSPTSHAVNLFDMDAKYADVMPSADAIAVLRQMVEARSAAVR